MKQITDGKKLAKAIKGTIRFDESKEKKTPFVAVTFGFTEESTGNYETLEWKSWLTPNTLERTMDTLIDVLGFNGNDEVNDKGYLVDPNALDWNKEVSITVRHNEQGYLEVQWVNNQWDPPNAASIKQKLEQVGFKAAFLAKTQGKKVAGSDVEVPF